MERSFRPERARSVGLITQYRCTFECQHCLYCSSPKVRETIDPSILEEVVRQMDHALGEALLHIGGGEPLMDFHGVKRLLSQLQGTRLKVEYLETNGSPLKTSTLAKLRELKEAGLTCLLLSISPFHNEFIPVRVIRQILGDIVSVLGTEGIFPWHPGFLPFLERVSTEETVPLERYVEAFSPSEIRNQLTSVMYLHPGGRGAELLARHLPLYPSEALLGHPCDQALGSPDHAHIDYEGNYLTGFCSGLRIGERTGLDLERLFADGIPLENYPLLDMLVNGGLKTLYAFALESGYSPRPQGYVSPCHLCLDMRVHLYSGGPDFPELYPGFFYDELPRAPFCP